MSDARADLKQAWFDSLTSCAMAELPTLERKGIPAPSWVRHGVWLHRSGLDYVLTLMEATSKRGVKVEE